MTIHPDIHAILASQRTGELIQQAYRGREQRRVDWFWRRRRAAARSAGREPFIASSPQAAPAR